MWETKRKPDDENLTSQDLAKAVRLSLQRALFVFHLLRLAVPLRAVAEYPDRAGQRDDRGGEQPEFHQRVMELLGVRLHLC
jgi:hypothetical protein